MEQSFPPDSQSAQAAGRWLALAGQLAVCAREVQRLTAVPAGLRLPEALLLWLCGQAEPNGIAQAELSRRLALSPAQASHLLEKLRRHGWFQAYRPAADRRCQRWRLTDRGQQVLAEIEQRLGPWVVQLEKQSGQALIDRVAEALSELTQALAACATAGNGWADHGAGSGHGGLLWECGSGSGSGAKRGRRTPARGAA